MNEKYQDKINNNQTLTRYNYLATNHVCLDCPYYGTPECNIYETDQIILKCNRKARQDKTKPPETKNETTIV